MQMGQSDNNICAGMHTPCHSQGVLTKSVFSYPLMYRAFTMATHHLRSQKLLSNVIGGLKARGKLIWITVIQRT